MGSVSRMRTFGRRYPRDWEADIGEILPRHAKYEAIIAKSRAEGSTWLSARAEGEAAVIGPDFDVLAVASDGCQASAGNSCRSSVICAMATLQTMERRVAFGLSRTLGPWTGRTQSLSQHCPPASCAHGRLRSCTGSAFVTVSSSTRRLKEPKLAFKRFRT